MYSNDLTRWNPSCNPELDCNSVGENSWFNSGENGILIPRPEDDLSGSTDSSEAYFLVTVAIGTLCNGLRELRKSKTSDHNDAQSQGLESSRLGRGLLTQWR